MNEQIREIQEYFISKILNNEFEVKECKQCTMIISIDNYLFEMWMANLPHNCKVYGSSDSFMKLDFTEVQAIECRNVLNLHYNKWKKEVLLTEKRAELEQLESEINAGKL